MGINNSINVSSPGIVGFTGTAFVETVVTQYDVLVGGSTSSTISSVGPGSAGQVLQSGGGSSNPVYSTATYPNVATGTGKVLIANGTNWVASTPTFPNASATSGKFIQSDGTNWIASTPTLPTTAGTSGKILISDGTNFISSTPTYPNAASTALKHIKSDGTNFVTTTVTYPDASVTAGKVIVSDGTNYIASTPTFPNASATTRKIIVSDGTNWVASTETYAVPGTSGNVLTSDGTNWTSAAPSTSGNTLLVAVTLTSAQVKALNATPITIIAAPGAGKAIVIVFASGSLNYGGTNVFTAAAAQTIGLYYNTTAGRASLLANAQIIASASQIDSFTGTFGAAKTSSTYDNIALKAYNPVATEIAGNAANNNTVTIYVSYYIHTI